MQRQRPQVAHIRHMTKINHTEREINIARDIYLKHGGRGHERIAAEVRARGIKFGRGRLYTLRRRGSVRHRVGPNGTAGT